MKPFSFFPVDFFIIVTVGFFFLILTLNPGEALKHNYYTKRDERSLIGPLGFPFGFLETGYYNLTVFDFQLSVPKKRHKHDTHSRLLINGDSESDSQSSMLSEVLENIKGVGFLLKKFEDEASFNHFIATVHADPTLCVFQQYIDLKEAEKMDDTIAQFYQDDVGFRYDDDVFKYDDYGGDYGGDYGDDYGGDYGGDFGIDGEDGRDYDENDDENFRRLQRPRQLNNRILDDEGEVQQGYGEVIDAVQDGIYLDMLPRSRWRPHSPSVAYNFEAGQAGFYFLIYQVCYKDNSENQKNENNFLDIHSRFELDFHFSNINMYAKTKIFSLFKKKCLTGHCFLLLLLVRY